MTAAACQHDGGRPAPESAVAGALHRAEARIAALGQRWTAPRRRVYELLVRHGRPVKAYDLMALFGAARAAKPPTVYRALEFLESCGLAHRIPSLNAYLACGHAGHDEAAGPGAGHAAAFLICDCCGGADEFAPDVLAAASLAAAGRGFRPREVSLEVRGRCGRCA